MPSFFEWVLSLFRREPEPPEQPTTPGVTSPLLTIDNPDATSLEIDIHQTQSLTDRNDRVPEQTVARYLAEAVGRAGYNSDIQFDYDTIPDAEYAAASVDALVAWSERSPDHAEHVNLLLTDANGGGIAFVGGRYAIAPGRNIDRLVGFRESGESDLYRNLRACLHEVGHTLGGRHSDGMVPRPWLTFQNTESGWMDSPLP